MDSLLRKFRMEEYIGIFEEEGITLEVLPSLKAEPRFLETLIPKMGHRLLFLKQLTEYLHAEEDINVVYVENGDFQEIHTHDTNIEVLSQSSFNDDDTSVITFQESLDNTQLQTSTPEEDNSIYFRSQSITSEDDNKSKNFQILETIAPEEPPLKIVKTLRCFIDNYNLKNTLEASAIGQGLLNWYNIKGSLDSQRQSYLVDIIVTDFLNNGVTHLTSAEYLNLSQKIVDLFPSEIKELYYVPPVRKRDSILNKSGLPKGKLVDKFKNKLTFLREAGILAARDKEVKQDTVELPTNEEDLLWLRHNREPLEEVYLHWDKLFTNRRQKFMKEGGDLAESFSEFPILKDPIGLRLIERDFERIFNNKSNNIYTEWESATNKLINLRKQYITQDSDKLLIDLLDSENLEEDYKNFIKLNLLPALLPNRSRHVWGKKRKIWKPTVKDCRNAIILKVNIPADIEIGLKERRQKLEQLEIPFHPFLIVETNGTTIKQAYVYMEENIYKVASILKGIDVCFKAYHAFHLRYQVECEHIWLFLQNRLYDIKTKWDNNIPTILEIVNKTK